MRIPYQRLLRDDADANAVVGGSAGFGGGLPGVLARLNAWNAGNSQWDRIVCSAPNGDSFSISTKGYVGTFAVGYVYNGASFDRLRSAAVFKHFASTALTAGTGITIWTPAAGKKFRLLGWCISTSVAGQLLFGDNVVGPIIARTPALAAAGYHDNPAGMGNGILSAAANNVLKLDGPTGNVAGMVWGTEE